MTAVTQHDGKFLAVDGTSNFDGIFTAVTQHDGKLPAADGFRFLGAASKWPVRLDRVSNDGYKSCRGLRIYSQALLWNSTSCRRRVRALRSLFALSPISRSVL